MHCLNLFQELVVDKSLWSLNYGPDGLFVKFRILLSDSDCYGLNKMVLILNIPLAWLQLLSKLPRKFFFLSELLYPEFGNSKIY